MNLKVVLLTGGRTGIGLEIATQLMNWNVCVYSASRQKCEAIQNPNGTGEIIPIQLDVNDETATHIIIEQIIKEKGRLDAVICNAGNGIAGSIEDTSTEEVKYQMETNFFGAVKTIQACLPIFRKQGYGKIMATSSVAAIVPIPYQAFYTAGKSALFSFMQALAMEVKPFGIQCCTVLPGDTKTEFTSCRKYTIASQSPDSIYRERMKKAVQKMEKDELAGMESSYVARKMVKELVKKRMRSIVVPGMQYKLIYTLSNILPVKWRLWGISKVY
ncbi:MAG: SDR family NAD(P)-dependent oxidoreductase [Bacteroides sp.]|nr:SDR family NAD(P)-dependent oxidoreductase [Bacteroides sp.]